MLHSARKSPTSQGKPSSFSAASARHPGAPLLLPLLISRNTAHRPTSTSSRTSTCKSAWPDPVHQRLALPTSSRPRSGIHYTASQPRDAATRPRHCRPSARQCGTPRGMRIRRMEGESVRSRGGSGDRCREARTAELVACSEMRFVTCVDRPCMTLISACASGRDASGCATRRSEGLFGGRGSRLRVSMSAERVGVYEQMYRSEIYCGLSSTSSARCTEASPSELEAENLFPRGEEGRKRG